MSTYKEEFLHPGPDYHQFVRRRFTLPKISENELHDPFVPRVDDPIDQTKLYIARRGVHGLLLSHQSLVLIGCIGAGKSTLLNRLKHRRLYGEGCSHILPVGISLEDVSHEKFEVALGRALVHSYWQNFIVNLPCQEHFFPELVKNTAWVNGFTNLMINFGQQDSYQPESPIALLQLYLEMIEHLRINALLPGHPSSTQNKIDNALQSASNFIQSHHISGIELLLDENLASDASANLWRDAIRSCQMYGWKLKLFIEQSAWDELQAHTLFGAEIKKLLQRGSLREIHLPNWSREELSELLLKRLSWRRSPDPLYSDWCTTQTRDLLVPNALPHAHDILIDGALQAYKDGVQVNEDAPFHLMCLARGFFNLLAQRSESPITPGDRGAKRIGVQAIRALVDRYWSE